MVRIRETTTIHDLYGDHVKRHEINPHWKLYQMMQNVDKEFSV